MEDELKASSNVHSHTLYLERREKDTEKNALVVDEVWWMMKSDDTASFLYSIAKRGRKYLRGLLHHNPRRGDFMCSPYGVPIVTNSSPTTPIETVSVFYRPCKNLFNLTDEEKYLLLESNVGGRDILCRD